MKKVIPVYNNTPDALAAYISREEFNEFYRTLTSEETQNLLKKSHKVGDFSQDKKIVNQVEFVVRSPEVTPVIDSYTVYNLGEDGDVGLAGYVPDSIVV